MKIIKPCGPWWKGIVNGRHPDVAAMAGSVADAGKGNQDNQDLVISPEKNRPSEHKRAITLTQVLTAMRITPRPA